jgi:plastocyanin
MSAEGREPGVDQASGHGGAERHGVPPIAYPFFAVLFGGVLVWAFSQILLAISDRTISIGSLHIAGKWATAAIALLMALNVLVGAALVAYGGRVRSRPASYPLLLGAGVLVIAGGVTAITLGKPPSEVPGQTVNLAAQGIAFQEKTLAFTAGDRVTVVFDNKDAGIQHNFVLFNGRNASAPQLFRGDVITGPGVIRYTITAPPPGTYFFHCEIHPVQMTGTVTVTSAPAGGAGPPGALQLTGKNRTYSPTTLSAKSGSQVTIHFTNSDPTIQHNFVLFNGRTATAPVLFTGPPVTGPGSIDYTFSAPPPGTYFFHCQFHPTTMQGTLTVT